MSLNVTNAMFCPVEVIDDLYRMINKKTNKQTPMISDFHHSIVMINADKLNSAIIYDRDFNFNYFGFKVCFLNFMKFSMQHFH